MISYRDFLLREYNNHEGEQILDQLNSKYKNRRICFTKGEFNPKSFKQSSLEPGEDYYPENYPKEYPHISPKPIGTWYALGAEWAKWLAMEMPDWWERYDRVYMIHIDYSNILRLNTIQKLKQFEMKYVQTERFPDYGTMTGPNWVELRKQYSGIEIIPYQWEMRNNSKGNWYNPWDIGSGCIWDKSAIKRVEEIQISLDPTYRAKFWDF